MATVTLDNKTPVKLAEAKSIMFVGGLGLYFGFGTIPLLSGIVLNSI